MPKAAVAIAVVVIVAAIATGVLLTGYMKPAPVEEAPPEAPEEAPPTAPTEEAQEELVDIYWGYMSLEKGDWAEWKYVFNGNETTMKVIYAGREVFNGETYIGFEVSGFEESGLPTEEGIELEVVAVQIWSSPTAGIGMYVIKTTEGVFKFTWETPTTLLEEQGIYAETPEFFKPENIPEGWESVTFTTETGKSVRCIKFQDPYSGAEIWLSSEVPFGMVKYGQPGAVMELRDFGRGAELTITKDEIETAQSFGELLGGL